MSPHNARGIHVEMACGMLWRGWCPTSVVNSCYSWCHFLCVDPREFSHTWHTLKLSTVSEHMNTGWYWRWAAAGALVSASAKRRTSQVVGLNKLNTGKLRAHCLAVSLSTDSTLTGVVRKKNYVWWRCHRHPWLLWKKWQHTIICSYIYTPVSC